MTAIRPNISVEFETDPTRSHEIVFAEISRLPRLLAGIRLPVGKCIVVSDSNVSPIYAETLAEALRSDGWDVRVVTLAAGEPTKSIDSVQTIVDAGLSMGLDRRSPVIALGGGVIGDVAGFAAAILLRGVPLVQVPTSLLAQVDSSIGGKTGINHPAGKNLVGAFHQPRLILSDRNTLSTLPDEEWLGGLSEVVKTALLADAAFTDFLRANWQQVLEREPDATAEIVYRCAVIKAEIVMADERESGRRALLNLGHTFGHALEKVIGYDRITHGRAVAAGMRAALSLSAVRYPDVDFATAIELVNRLPSPPTLAGITAEMLMDAMLSDKKRAGARLRFVVLERPGSATVVDDVRADEIRSALVSSLGPFGLS